MRGPALDTLVGRSRTPIREDQDTLRCLQLLLYGVQGRMLRAPGSKMDLGTFAYEVKVQLSSKTNMQC